MDGSNNGGGLKELALEPAVGEVLAWMQEHRRGTAAQVAADLRVESAPVGARLRQLCASGEVRRSGREVEPPRGGRPQTEYELVTNETEAESMSTTVMTEADVAVLEDLKSGDLIELLAAYCGEITLATAETEVLLFVLRIRRVADVLQRAEGAGDDGED